MRFFLATVRVLASLFYCLLGFAACIFALLVLWSLIAGTIPFAGVLAHGNVPLLSVSFLVWSGVLLVPLVCCDIYFRVTKRYMK